MESDPPTNDESADIPLSGDRVSLCICKVDSSLWTVVSAMMFEEKLVVCKKSKKSGAMYVTLFLSSDRTNFQHLAIPMFHGVPVAEFVLSKPVESALCPATPPSCLQYRPLFKVILPSQSRLEGTLVGECIEAELFYQLFRLDCPLSDAAVLLVCGPNGNILYSNLTSISFKNLTKQHPPSRDPTASSNCREFFKPLYSLDQPIVSVHAAAFPKRPEQVDPLLYCGEDSDLVRDTTTPNSLIFVGQRGKVTLCFANVSVDTSQTQRFPKFIEYNVPGPVLSSKLVPGQCLVYNSFTTLHRICLRQACFKEVEERAPQFQLQRGPLMIPEASFKFPERVAVSVLPSVILDCERFSASQVGQEASCEEIGLTLAGLKGHLRALKVKVCGVEEVSRDPDMVAKEIKHCLNSIQITGEQILAISGKISKMDASLSELNHVLTLLCTVKCQQEEGAPVITGELGSPVECAVSAGFTDRGILERAMCIDVRFSYQGKKTLGSGWSLLIQVSPSSYNFHDNDLLSARRVKEGGVADDVGPTTPTTLSRSVPLEGLSTNGVIEEKVSVASIFKKPLCFSVSCYLQYDSSNLLSSLGSNSDHTHSSCDDTVSVLVSSRLLDALDFTRPSSERPRRLHDPLALATSCLDPDNRLPKRELRQGLLHSLQLPIGGVSHTPVQQSTNQPSIYRQLSVLLLPHIEGVEEKFRSRSEVSLTCYDGSGINLRLVKQELGTSSRQERTSSSDALNLSLVLHSSSRSQLAEASRCVTNRLQRKSCTDTTTPDDAASVMTQEELYTREAELKGISREAVSLLDQVRAVEKFSKEPSAAEKVELVSKTFSLYSKLRQLP